MVKSNRTQHTQNWIDKLQEETQQLEPTAQFVIEKEDVENAIKKTLNGKPQTKYITIS